MSAPNTIAAAQSLRSSSAVLAPAWEERGGAYRVSFAQDAADVRAAQRLRYRVFADELGAELSPGGYDCDPLDRFADHLIVSESATNCCVGTYRLTTREHVWPGPGFYTEREFDLSRLPPEILRDGVELGRACVHPDHRGRRALHLLWRGIGAYLMEKKKRFLFGCASVHVADPSEAANIARALADHVDPEIAVAPRADYAVDLAPESDAHFELPPLMRVYFSMGSKVCATPAYDPEFHTLDFFTLFDLERLDARSYARYCG